MAYAKPRKTAAEHQERVMNSQYYLSGDHFKAHEICSLLGVSVSVTRSVLQNLGEDGFLNKHDDNHGQQGSNVTYTRRRTSNLIHAPWRTQSLESDGMFTPRYC